MGKIRIVGLGPMDEKGLTKEAMDVIENGCPNFLRTENHSSVRYFQEKQIPYTSFDSFYETKESFDEIYFSIAQSLMEEAKKSDINYFVPGHPLIAEKTVIHLIESGCEYQLINGMSFLEPMLSAVGKDPIDGLKLINGDDFSDLDLDIHTDTIVTQVYNQRIATELKIAIGDMYGDAHELYLISHAGIQEKEKVHKIMAFELDRMGELTHETSIYLPKVAKNQKYSLKDLFEITRQLRGENGCPWDRVQTHESIKANLIEESYEALYALEKGDMMEFEEEMGDVLFQVVFHSEIAGEEGDFTFSDVVSSICEKLIRRHPHVFGEGKADWEAIKMEENNRRTIESRLDHLKGLPALMHGQKALRILKSEGKSSSYAHFSQEESIFSDELTEENLGKILLYWVEKGEEKGIDAESALKELLLRLEEENKESC